MMQDWHVPSLLQDWVALDGSNLDENASVSPLLSTLVL
jgi:hypothetical protein